MIIVLPNEAAEGHDEEDPKQKGNQYPTDPFLQQLFPISVLHGEVNTHARHKEHQRDPPDIQHGHGNPERCPGLLIGDKSQHDSPGLETNGNMVE